MKKFVLAMVGGIALTTVMGQGEASAFGPPPPPPSSPSAEASALINDFLYATSPDDLNAALTAVEGDDALKEEVSNQIGSLCLDGCCVNVGCALGAVGYNPVIVFSCGTQAAVQGDIEGATDCLEANHPSEYYATIDCVSEQTPGACPSSLGIASLPIDDHSVACTRFLNVGENQFSLPKSIASKETESVSIDILLPQA